MTEITLLTIKLLNSVKSRVLSRPASRFGFGPGQIEHLKTVSLFAVYLHAWRLAFKERM